MRCIYLNLPLQFYSNLKTVLFLQARTKFRWAVRVVIVFGRVLKVLMSHSANIVPETATQRSFRTLRDNSEAKEVLFNKSLYQRGKSVRIGVLK